MGLVKAVFQPQLCLPIQGETMAVPPYIGGILKTQPEFKLDSEPLRPILEVETRELQ